MFSFLYRVFYDRTLFSTYVKNGRGYGIKLLFILTCFASVCVVVRLLYMFSSAQPRLINEFLAQVPEIVFKNGEISSPENIKFSYIPENGSVFFVFDTTKQPVDLNGLPPSGIYITTDALLTISHRETRRIPFVKWLHGNDLALSQEELRKSFEEMFSISRMMFPPLIFFLCLPGAFSIYFFMTIIAFLFSFPIGRAVKVLLSNEERIRLSVLSVVPVCVINGGNLILKTNISPTVLGSTVLMVFLYCFLKDGQIANKD